MGFIKCVGVWPQHVMDKQVDSLSSQKEKGVRDVSVKKFVCVMLRLGWELEYVICDDSWLCVVNVFVCFVSKFGSVRLALQYMRQWHVVLILRAVCPLK